jgi:hypothetical protein
MKKIILELDGGDYIWSTSGDFEKNMRDGRLEDGEAVEFSSAAEAETQRKICGNPNARVAVHTVV